MLCIRLEGAKLILVPILIYGLAEIAMSHYQSSGCAEVIGSYVVCCSDTFRVAWEKTDVSSDQKTPAAEPPPRGCVMQLNQ